MIIFLFFQYTLTLFKGHRFLSGETGGKANSINFGPVARFFLKEGDLTSLSFMGFWVSKVAQV